jgi:putative MFS transporter
LLPQLQSSFHVRVATLGVASIPIGAGQFISLFLVRKADHVGRRAILLVSIAGYVTTTGLTALSWGIWSFAAFQTLSQIFVGAELGLAVIVVIEEFPARRRGRALSWVLIAGPLGVIMTAVLLAVGLAHSPLGWRAFYLISVAPVLFLPVLVRALRETSSFQARSQGTQWSSSWRSLFVAPWRSRILAIGLFSFLVKIPITGGAAWWVYYAERERHLSTSVVSLDLALAFGLGTAGFYLCGRAMDRFGRRPTTTLFLTLASLSAIALFQSKSEGANFIFLMLAVFFGLGVGPGLNAIGTEAFATEIRAHASAIVGNGFASLGGLAGPALIGILGDAHGAVGSVGTTVCVLSPLILVALPLVWLFVPETRDLSLQGSESWSAR